MHVSHDQLKGPEEKLGIIIVESGAIAPADGARSRRYAVVDALDDTLQYERQFIETADAHQLVNLLRSAARGTERRSKVLKRVEAKGGVALVDALVETAISYSGSSVGSAVAALRSGERCVTLAIRDRPQVKAWLEHGRLVCSFELSPQLRWTPDRLLVRVPLSETLKDGLIGRSVHGVAVHPMLPESTRISSYVSIGSQSEFRLRSATGIVQRDELMPIGVG